MYHLRYLSSARKTHGEPRTVVSHSTCLVPRRCMIRLFLSMICNCFTFFCFFKTFPLSEAEIYKLVAGVPSGFLHFTIYIDFTAYIREYSGYATKFQCNECMDPSLPFAFKSTFTTPLSGQQIILLGAMQTSYRSPLNIGRLDIRAPRQNDSRRSYPDNGFWGRRIRPIAEHLGSKLGNDYCIEKVC